MSPYWGGASIVGGLGCTSGFAWHRSPDVPFAMLTAGHCSPGGGRVWTGGGRLVGDIQADYDENWNVSQGTVRFPGQSVFRGDLALIRVPEENGLRSGPYIYTGGPGSSSYLPVEAKWRRRAAPGDRYCVGGAATGEICDFTVAETGRDIEYASGNTIRNAAWGDKFGFHGLALGNLHQP